MTQFRCASSAPARPAAVGLNAVPGETTADLVHHGTEGSEAAGAGFGSRASEKPLRTRGHVPLRGEASPFPRPCPWARGQVSAGVKRPAGQLRQRPRGRCSEGPWGREPLSGARAAPPEPGLAKGSCGGRSHLWPQMHHMWEKHILYKQILHCKFLKVYVTTGIA